MNEHLMTIATRLRNDGVLCYMENNGTTFEDLDLIQLTESETEIMASALQSIVEQRRASGNPA